MGVELHIEELVLHGFAARDRHRIAGAVQLELTRLMSESRLPASRQTLINLERLQGSTFQVKGGAKPEATGAQIARTVVIGIHDEHRTAISEPRTEPHRMGNGPPTECRRMHTISGRTQAVAGGAGIT